MSEYPVTHTQPNVDPDEIAKFEKLAARWWDPTSEFKPLHEINPLRLAWINERVKLAGLKVLDVGCGGGILAESMAALGARVTAIDLGEAPLAVARLHLKESGQHVEYRRIAAEDLAREQPGAFDVVTCLEMLEHVPDPAATVAACTQLVKPGGQVFFSTINRNPKSWVFAIVYRKFIRPSELERNCRHAGLRVRELTGMHYNPLTQHYTLGPGVDVNYLLHAERVAD
jgi:2-polyprenyl-6-hydroxyphenyl methylase/3-demethylubiquinone-9 3-methyltransferase